MERNSLTVIDGDARIPDRRLSEALGFNRINDLHRLIRACADELNDFGEVLCFEAKNPSPRGGRPIKTFFLNEHQAVLISMKAETVKAREGRRLIIEVFTAWRKGQLDQMVPPAVDPFTVNADRTGHVAAQSRHLSEMDGLHLRVTHLPLWRNGKRPWWWSNTELRRFLTESHRQMMLAECVRAAEAQFSVKLSISGLQRYWALLDRVRGPVPVDRPVKRWRVA